MLEASHSKASSRLENPMSETHASALKIKGKEAAGRQRRREENKK